MNLPTELVDFEGIWQISRQIEDALGAQSGRFAGTAEIAPFDDRHRYSETGILTLETGGAFAAERRYLWRDAGPGRIAAFFEDGRPFHEIALGGAAEATHHCPPDTYRVAYDFRAWPLWHATWHVTGPKKDYRMISTFRRA